MVMHSYLASQKAKSGNQLQKCGKKGMCGVSDLEPALCRGSACKFKLLPKLIKVCFLTFYDSVWKAFLSRMKRPQLSTSRLKWVGSHLM